MSKEVALKDGDAPKKKGKGVLLFALGGLVLLGAGGGGVFALMQSGMLGGVPAHKEPDVPKLVVKGEDDPYAPVAKKEEGPELVYGEGGSKYRTIYYNFEGSFTSNLKDSEAMVQLSLAASTRRDGRMLMWLKEHELAIRSAILVVLGDTPEADAVTPEGKERLQQRLTAAINKVLVEEEGFGGVDAVHFQTFVVQ